MRTPARVLLLSFLLALAVAPSAAVADQYTDAPPAQGPPPTQSPQSVSPDATSAVGNFVCQTGTNDDSFVWSYVASVPAGYVTANCYDGWHLHRTMKSAYVSSEDTYYDGGYFYGDIDGCGWIRVTNDVKLNNDSFTACTSPSRSPSEFAYAINCQPGQCSDGTVAQTHGTCPEYANVRPWSSTPSAIDLVRPDKVGTLLWRYIVRHTATDGKDYVMVRDSGVAAGQGNWVFVPLDCLMTPLPPYGGDPNNYYYP